MDLFPRLLHPGLLAAAIVATLAFALFWSRADGVGRWLALPAVALLCAVLLRADTVPAYALLMLLALLAAGYASGAAYTVRGPMPIFAAVCCVMLRFAAILIVMLIIARPSWRATQESYEKPLLVVLLDHSRSMDIRDRTADPDAKPADADNPPQADEGRAGPTRAMRVAAALRRAASARTRLDQLYEIQPVGFGVRNHERSDWSIQPADASTDLADALAHALQRRSFHGDSPSAVLVISDGADNVRREDVPAVLHEAVERRIPIFSVGVGPAPGVGRRLALTRLDAPRRVGPRERVAAAFSAEVEGCAGAELTLDWFWNADPPVRSRRRVTDNPQRIDDEFEADPPGPGLHRLTLRLALPDSHDGLTVERSVVVEVDERPIRVLIMDRHPRPEFAFITRVLRADPRFEVDSRLIDLDPARRASIDWSSFDVIFFGSVPSDAWSPDAMTELADAVELHGSGLALLGGHELFNAGGYGTGALPRVSPSAFTLRRVIDEETAAFRPSDHARDHPLLAGVDHELPETIWNDLPPLRLAGRLGDPRPLAVVLAEDAEGRPLLATIDIGRGRSLAAAWAQTWPWALRSDEGFELHARFWRQAAAWLSNRRPQAWVLPVETIYSLGPLQAGRQSVRIRAGVSGLGVLPVEIREWDVELMLSAISDPDDADAGGDHHDPRREAEARPEASPDDATGWEIPLRRGAGAEWLAEIGAATGLPGFPAAGEYELVFRARPRAIGPAERPAVTPAGLEELSARGLIRIEHVDLEFREPTADLARLETLAQATQSVGGRYAPLEQLGELLEELGREDRRRRVERQVVRIPTQDQPWWVYGLVLGCLGLEWSIRRRWGLG